MNREPEWKAAGFRSGEDWQKAETGFWTLLVLCLALILAVVLATAIF